MKPEQLKQLELLLETAWLARRAQRQAWVDYHTSLTRTPEALRETWKVHEKAVVARRRLDDGIEEALDS